MFIAQWDKSIIIFLGLLAHQSQCKNIFTETCSIWFRCLNKMEKSRSTAQQRQSTRIYDGILLCMPYICAHDCTNGGIRSGISGNVYIWLLMRPSLMWWLSIHFKMFCSEMLHIFIWACEWVSECLLMCESSAFLMCSLCQCSFSVRMRVDT